MSAHAVSGLLDLFLCLVLHWLGLPLVDSSNGEVHKAQVVLQFIVVALLWCFVVLQLLGALHDHVDHVDVPLLLEICALDVEEGFCAGFEFGLHL